MDMLGYLRPGAGIDNGRQLTPGSDKMVSGVTEQFCAQAGGRPGVRSEPCGKEEAGR